jgi:hypothetical protein
LRTRTRTTSNVAICQKIEDELAAKTAKEVRRAVAAAAARKAASARKQADLHQAFGEGTTREVDEQWAKAFYNCGIAFNVADDPEFRKAVQLTSQVLLQKSQKGWNKPVYTNPHRRAIGGALLISTDVSTTKQRPSPTSRSSAGRTSETAAARCLARGRSSTASSIKMMSGRNFAGGRGNPRLYPTDPATPTFLRFFWRRWPPCTPSCL